MSSKLQWTQTIETYISNKLRDRSSEGAPLVLTNSQFVIDGIVLAINDHPLEYRESFMAVQNVVETRGRALASNSTRNASSAALELYVAWCVFDGVAKGTVINDLHQLACNALPMLVGEFMPVFVPEGGPRSRLHEAADAYSKLYWNMVRSWVSGQVFPQEVLNRCTDALTQQIHQYQSEVVAGNDEGPVEVQDAVVAKVLSGLTHAPTLTRASGAAAITSLMNSYYAVGRDAQQLMCVYCGASFPTAEGRKEHVNYHKYLVEGKHLNRLLCPTTDGFVRTSGEHSTGAFARIAVPQQEVGTGDAVRIGFPSKY